MSMYLKAMVDGYVECALWSSSDESDDPLDDRFSASDVELDTFLKMRADAEGFYAGYKHLFGDVSPGQVGHDFWLSRNGHGAGFFDGPYGEHCGLLQRPASSTGRNAQGDAMADETHEASLTDAQTADLRRLKATFPFRIVWGAVCPATGEFVCSASYTRRQANAYARNGWTVFVLAYVGLVRAS